MTGWLDGTSVLVTGGGSGLGRAIVHRFRNEGARVLVLDRSAEKLEALRAEYSGDVLTVQGAVDSAADNTVAVETAVAAFGGLDVFIGNAGIWDFSRSLMETPADELAGAFDELFAVNVKGYLLGAKAAAHVLRESRGSMIFTLSNAAFFPGGGGPLYTAAKHAGLGLVRQLAYELAPEIRVNGVAPGGMATDLRGPEALGLGSHRITDTLPMDQLREHSALHRVPTPEDYVGAYVLLASRANSPTVTGSVLDISSVGTPRRPPARPVHPSPTLRGAHSS